MAESQDIDRLLEEGLTCYGSGDLEGALSAWQQVLALEPGHVQATSYIGYVRENYDTLLRSKPQAAGGPPLPAHDRSEYQIEVSPGDLAPPGALLRPPSDHEGKDDPWLEEQETINPAAAAVAPPEPEDGDDGDYELELAEDPAGDGDDSAGSGDGDDEDGDEEGTFGGTTREYQGGPAKEFQLDEPTSSFHPEATPIGFATQDTDVKKRELGFVQPAPPADLQVRLRTPEVAPGRPTGKTGKVAIGTAPTVEIDNRAPAVSATRTTQDLPAKTRPPGPPTRPPIDPTAVSQAEVVLQHAPTKDLLREEVPVPAPDVMDPRAPTRELGLRGNARPATSDDSPTREADVRAFREQHARDRAGATTARSLPSAGPRAAARPAAAPTPPEPPPPPAEPVDASTAALLADIDADAPAGETAEDRTRRRIGALASSCSGRARWGWRSSGPR